MPSAGFTRYGSQPMNPYSYPHPVVPYDPPQLYYTQMPSAQPSSLDRIITLNNKSYVTITLSTMEEFLTWKTQFQAVLVMHQIHGFLDGSVPIPPASIIDPRSGQLHSNPDHDTWVRIDQCLCSWTFATIGTGILTEVRELVHGFQIWNRLNSRFNVTCLSRVMELKDFFITYPKVWNPNHGGVPAGN